MVTSAATHGAFEFTVGPRLRSGQAQTTGRLRLRVLSWTGRLSSARDWAGVASPRALLAALGPVVKLVMSDAPAETGPAETGPAGTGPADTGPALGEEGAAGALAPAELRFDHEDWRQISATLTANASQAPSPITAYPIAPPVPLVSFLRLPSDFTPIGTAE